ncbi:MAG TPA: SulP family inorganic anion transporter [Clostridiales bacterium]|jgi:SulP family sulfate permease|nr:SulP family inorganic anion transporter [Clostridiales bacterium]
MFQKFISMLKFEFGGYNTAKLGKDVMAGLTVTAVALPLALAFGVSSGADAAAGLVTAILAGLLIGALSGASFQISGPTGAMSAILIGIVAKYGPESIFTVSFLAGIIILLVGLLKLGKLVNMIPRPVITGFTSGIAIIIALGQIDNFFGTVSNGENVLEKMKSYGALGFVPNWSAVLIGLVVIAVMLVWPKKWNARVPSSLVAIIVAAIVSISLGLDIKTVGEIPKSIFLNNRLKFSSLEWNEIKKFISPAISIAALGMIESLLCGAAGSRMKKEPFDADQELLSQGIGNVIIPFFGGVPATAAIARSSVAIKSGAQTRLCGIFHAVGLLVSMFLLGPVMAQLPLSALAGVLIVTSFRMHEWKDIKYMFVKKFKTAIFKFSITMIATVVFDLTIAILIGIAVSALLFLWQAAKLEVNFSRVKNEKFIDHRNVEKNHPRTTVVYVTGPVFFANAGTLVKKMEEIDPNCNELIFSLRGVPVMDISGVETICELCEEWKQKGTRIKICGTNNRVRTALERAEIEKRTSQGLFFWSVDKALIE